MSFHDMPDRVFSPYRPPRPWTAPEKVLTFVAAVGWGLYLYTAFIAQ